MCIFLIEIYFEYKHKLQPTEWFYVAIYRLLKEYWKNFASAISGNSFYSKWISIKELVKSTFIKILEEDQA